MMATNTEYMYVCIYVSLYVCMQVCIYVCYMCFACSFTRVNVSLSVCMYVYMYCQYAEKPCKMILKMLKWHSVRLFDCL